MKLKRNPEYSWARFSYQLLTFCHIYIILSFSLFPFLHLSLSLLHIIFSEPFENKLPTFILKHFSISKENGHPQ